MDLNKLINKILSSRPGLSEEKLKELMEEKKRAYGGLLSDEGAARLVAQELSIDVGKGSAVGGMKIKDLVAGLSDVTTTGRVIIEWPIQGFESGGRRGAVKRLMLADDTGEVVCVAWNDKAEALEREGGLEGKVLKVLHGYTREGLRGDVEIHIGNRGSALVSPAGVDGADFPKLDAFMDKIKDIEGLERANIGGTVTTQPRVTTFESGGSTGKVLRTTLSDPTGSVALVAWGEQAERLGGIKVGDFVRVMNGRVKVGLNGSLEVHAEKQTVLRIVEGKAGKEAAEELKISKLKPGMKGISLSAKLVKAGGLRRIEGARGEAFVLDGLLGDETGLVIARFWGENAKFVSGVEEGALISVKFASTRVRGRFLTLNVDGAGAVDLAAPRSDLNPPTTRIGDLKAGGGLVAVEGVVVDISPVKEVETSRGERVAVSSLTLNDGSGEVRLTLWREAAKESPSIKVGQKIRVIGAFPKERWDGKLELSSLRLTKVEALQ